MRSVTVSIAEQRLFVYDDATLVTSFLVSTAHKGVGQQQGSECTPLGVHEIVEKIGAGAARNTVFVGRKPTGDLYSDELAAQYPERDWILSRILWLSGLEPGVNQGGEVDSQQRYIYIHGAPQTRPMGEPHSHGCITLHVEDILQLFELVEVGTRVTIVA